MDRRRRRALILAVFVVITPLIHAIRVIHSSEGAAKTLDVEDEFGGQNGEPFSRSLRSFERSRSKGPVTVATSPEEHLVASLPGLKKEEFPTRHHAGYIPVKDGFHFYWLFESTDSDHGSEDPLVIWLNGGPGCSSMDGLWLENGPFRLDKHEEITVNPYSWHNVANVMYVDQPVGTGLSFTTSDNYADNDLQVDEQFYLFLTNFFELHSQYKTKTGTTRPVFFTGESHAGHYIPSMITYILEMNKAATTADKGGLVIDVQGMAIGNGWFDPMNQYDVSDFAFGMGLIDGGQRRALKKQEEKCIKSLKANNYADHTCLGLMDAVVAASNGRMSGTPKVSMYDVRTYEVGRQFPPGHTIVEAYLNRDNVREAIHATSCPLKFKECTDPPFLHLSKWDGLGVTKEVRQALNAGVRSLFFNGQFDLICNHVGNQKALMNLGDWKGAKEWEESMRGVWLSDGNEEDDGGRRRPLGYVKEKAGNPLTFLMVLNSGHMVPLDHPRPALDMLSRFLKGELFSDSEQKALGVGSCSDPDIDCDASGASCSTPSNSASGAPAGAAMGLDAEFATALSASSPEIVADPDMGQDLATVWFVPNKHDEAFLARAKNDAEILYEVTSSPEGRRVLGRSPPISVEGLVPGRTYTFSVTAIYLRLSEDGERDVYDVDFDEGAIRSRPSIGSAAVTPGCRLAGGVADGQRNVDSRLGQTCFNHGVCVEDGYAGVCLCEKDFIGEKCGVLSIGRTRGGGRGKDAGETALGPYGGRDIKLLREDDLSVLRNAEPGDDKPGSLSVQFYLQPGAFGDPDFVFAIRTPRPVPPVEFSNTGHGDPARIPTDTDALDTQASGFSALLRADVARALGVPMKAVELRGVSPTGETQVDWQAWRQWGSSALNVSLAVTSDAPGKTGRHLMVAWNDAESRLHFGAITRLIDFAQSVDVKMLPEDGVGRASSRKAEKFKGPSLLATFLYIICFAVAVPVCGISRRCYSRRARGINSAHNGVSDAGGSISLANRRKGWRVSSGTGNRGWEGGNAGSQEGVSLVGEEVDSSARERGV